MHLNEFNEINLPIVCAIDYSCSLEMSYKIHAASVSSSPYFSKYF